MTTLYARYYQGDEMVAQNELTKTTDLTADVEKITVHIYGDKR